MFLVDLFTEDRTSRIKLSA